MRVPPRCGSNLGSVGVLLCWSLLACDSTGGSGPQGPSTSPVSAMPSGDSGRTSGAGSMGDVHDAGGTGTSGSATTGGDVLRGRPGCEEGFWIGERCVLWKHIEHIGASPQPTDPGNLVYDFDKSYDNLGALKKEDPKVPPSAKLGEWYMYNGDFVRIGVSYDSFATAGGEVAPEERLSVREERNQELPYNLNAVKAHDGTDIAAPNCTVCHSNYFGGRLVQGLGRNRHWIGTDASGFTLNVFGIGLASFAHGDTLEQLDHGLGMLTRLFRDTSHSHLFDLFAALGMRHDPDSLEWTGELWGDPNSGMEGWIDFPPWWNMRKKNALYSAGVGRGYKADHLLYMSWFSLDGIEEAEEIQNNFVHVQKWLEEEIHPPKFEDFGGTIEQGLADMGELVFLEYCSTCHGTYSDDEEEETYPNFLVHLDEIGTDPRLATNHWIYPAKLWYDVSWYGKRGTSSIVEVSGYMAPPLDGIFITAPYFHNGSVPTLEAVLDPSKRPVVWTSDMSEDDYDWEAVGWKSKPLDTTFWTLDQRQGTYVTTDPGNSKEGHTYGNQLNADQKRAVLEYLKTL